MIGLGLRAVTAAYDGTPALRGIDLEVAPGSWTGLIGPNGSGKTTLLRAVAGLMPHGGTVLLGGEEVARMPRRAAARLVAYVPQRPVVPEPMPVIDYVLTGRTPYISYLGSEGVSDLEVAARVLARLELEDLAERPLGTLSGGELQRAIIGRALAQGAPLLLLDEPTSALDVGHQQQALELIDALRREEGLTVVAAMHDLTLAGQFAERLILLDRGTVAAEGPVREVLTESTIGRHYGARVRILDDDGGGVVVIPVRDAAAAPAGEREKPA
ncbi:MAG TPA: ABC transporter ATP-binding protein [Actinomycetota bacterium]